MARRLGAPVVIPYAEHGKYCKLYHRIPIFTS
nr:MAG TPA: hypothetical protein [Bacteriophage sp.]